MTGRPDGSGGEPSGHLDELARMLSDAWDRALTVDAPTTLHPHLGLDEAYQIQDRIVEHRSAGGRRPAGWKMGLTSSPEAVPIVGTLLDDMVVESGTTLDRASMVAPLIEAEIAFVVGEPIPASIDLKGLAAGSHEVAAAIEVIDYRTEDSSNSIDWVADNATVAYAVLGRRKNLAEVCPLREVGVSLRRGDETIARGEGSLVMDDPLRAITWLAGHLAERGKALDPGAVVLTGSLTGHHVTELGVRYEAAFDQLGSVSVGFA